MLRDTVCHMVVEGTNLVLKESYTESSNPVFILDIIVTYLPKAEIVVRIQFLRNVLARSA